jgi:hypothetical protein
MKKQKEIAGKSKKSTEQCETTHTKEYEKHHEKGKYPRRVWPTDSEKAKDKGPKI